MNPKNVKFRGKSKKTGEWLYGDLVRNVEGAFAIVPPFEMTTDNLCDKYEVDENTIGQLLFTIYHDDGTSSDVYIGDVVSMGLDDGTRELMEIDDFSSSYVEIFCDVIVEGNIHDNPELLDKIAEQHEDRRASTEP